MKQFTFLSLHIYYNFATIAIELFRDNFIFCFVFEIHFTVSVDVVNFASNLLKASSHQILQTASKIKSHPHAISVGLVNPSGQ